MEFYPFRFDEKKLRPLLQRDLYTDPNVVLRELAQNAHDAIVRRGKLDKSFKPERDGKIVFAIDKFRGTLDVSDNGVGMSRDGILNTFRYYGRSDKVADDEVGAFGLGAKSIFAATDSFTIHSKSMESGEVSQVYAKPEGLAFQDSPPSRECVGTTVTIATKVKDTGEWRREDDEYDDPFDDEENKKERQGLDIATLRMVCRCVRIPIFIRKGDREELVSQQNPWKAKTAACLHADGFDVYFTGKKFGDCKFFMEGFLIFQQREYEGGALAGLESFAVNFTRKDMINLTMSRDSVIKDEKYRAALRAVYKAMIKHAQEVPLDLTSLKGNEADFIKWLNGCRSLQHKLWAQVPFEVKNAVEVLTGDIMICKPTSDARTTTDKAHLIDLLDSTHHTYYLLGRRKSEIEAVSIEKNATIIYSTCQINRSELTEWMREVNIRPIKNKRAKNMDERIVCTPNGTSRYMGIRDLNKDPELPDYPAVVFPGDVKLQQLQRTARYLGICAIRIGEGEDVSSKCADLRKISDTARVVVHGKAEKADTVALENVKVAPPQFFKFAQASKRLSIVFTPDVATACCIIKRGAEFMDAEDMREVLELAIPEKMQDQVGMDRAGDIHHFRNIAALVSSLDMNDRRTPWLLMIASCQPDWANDMAEELATPPPLGGEISTQERANNEGGGTV